MAEYYDVLGREGKLNLPSEFEEEYRNLRTQRY